MPADHPPRRTTTTASGVHEIRDADVHVAQQLARMEVIMECQNENISRQGSTIDRLAESMTEVLRANAVASSESKAVHARLQELLAAADDNRKNTHLLHTAVAIQQKALADLEKEQARALHAINERLDEHSGIIQGASESSTTLEAVASRLDDHSDRFKARRDRGSASALQKALSSSILKIAAAIAAAIASGVAAYSAGRYGSPEAPATSPAQQEYRRPAR